MLKPKRAATSPEPPPELGRRAARGLGTPTFERARRHTDAVEQICGRVSARSVEEPVEDPCQAVVAKERRRVVVEDGRDHESRECILLHAVPPAAVEVTDVTQRQHDVRRGEACGLRGGDRREREDLGSERPERRRSDDDTGVGEQGLVREVVRRSSARWGSPPGVGADRRRRVLLDQDRDRASSGRRRIGSPRRSRPRGRRRRSVFGVRRPSPRACRADRPATVDLGRSVQRGDNPTRVGEGAGWGNGPVIARLES